MIKYQKLFAICGMLGPIIYTMMWIIGGILQPEYSHIRDDISDLLARGAPNKLLMDIMNIVASILLLIFFLSLHQSINKGEGSKVGPISLVISGFLGLLVALFFPLGPNGEFTDWRAVTHATIIFAQIPITMIAMIAIWRRLKKLEEWIFYSTFLLVAFVLTMVFGIMTPMSIGTDYMGLVERLAICTIELFYFMLGLGAYRTYE